MVDFSSRDEVKRWLDAIQPAKRQREVAVAIAARAALRVLPLLAREVKKRHSKPAGILRRLLAPCLRGTALPWAAARYPAHDNELRAHAAAAAFAASYAAAAYAATADAADAADAASAAAEAAAAAAASSAAAAASAAAASAAAVAYTAGDASPADDAALIDAGRSTADLAGRPLWPNGAPTWASEAWRDLKSALLARGEDWDVWTDWYEARLAGDAAHPANEALEIARATIPDETWKRGPAVVNAEIKRLIAEHAQLQPRPGAFAFRVVDDRIDARPVDGRPHDAGAARDLYDETKRKGKVLRDYLLRAQADEQIRAHLDLLLARLGATYADMKPGLMIGVLRSLESDVRAYDSEEGRKELSEKLLSNILDVTESVRDLCAVFPISREIEAERVSLSLPMERMPEIRASIGSAIDKVDASDGVTDDGRAAINDTAANLAHQRGLAEEAKQSSYFLVDFANFTRAGLRHLKSAGAAVTREVGGLAGDGWRAVRRGAPRGIERGAAHLGHAVIVGGVGALMHALAGDVAALGGMIAAYDPLSHILQNTFAESEPAPPVDDFSPPPADETLSPGPDPPPPPKPRRRTAPARPAVKRRASKKTDGPTSS